MMFWRLKIMFAHALRHHSLVFMFSQANKRYNCLETQEVIDNWIRFRELTCCFPYKMILDVPNLYVLFRSMLRTNMATHRQQQQQQQQQEQQSSTSTTTITPTAATATTAATTTTATTTTTTTTTTTPTTNMATHRQQQQQQQQQEQHHQHQHQQQQ